MTPRCKAERAREFARARNAEIEASLAAYNLRRAALALRRSHCKVSQSKAPVCEAERAREFAAARNAEIDASLAAVKAARELALSKTHCKTPDSTTPRCEAERAREFAKARNAEIRASLARTFAAARNAEINASLAAVAVERQRAFVAARNAEIDASLAAVAFVRERNAEIDASLAAVKAERARAFAAARNTEIDASLAAVAFVRERNAEIDASLAAVKADRARAFAAARNAEIDASLAAYRAQRALRLALSRRHLEVAALARQAGVETGAINISDLPVPRSQPAQRRMAYNEPCHEAGRPLNALEFSRGVTTIEDSMKPELDRLAAIAKGCPAVNIEIHGHSDASGPAHVNRHTARRRAQAVRDYLIARGVAPRHLAAIGHGAETPRMPGSPAMNRRVELQIKDPAMVAAAARVMWDLAELLDPTYVPVVARLSP